MAREQLNIGLLPGRKRKALSITTFHDGGGATTTPVAYFRSEKAYEHFKRVLDGKALYLADSEVTSKGSKP